VDSYDTNSVLRYDESTGAFVDTFVPKGSGGLYSPGAMIFGPDHNLYVSNGLFSPKGQPNNVLRYDGTTGAFLGVFADGRQLTDPRGVLFGRDGNLYVGDGDGPGRVLRFDGQTGAFLDTFVPLSSGGLSHPATGMLFGPDGNLYVIAGDQSEVLRYDGRTGAFLGTFIASGSNGLDIPIGMAFGRDGNLYVANTFAGTGGGILRFEGPAGPNPGAFIDTFVAPGSGGLQEPLSVIFGPGGNLYVGSAESYLPVKPHTSTVLRYDGTTGAFLGTFVAPDSGGLRCPEALLFSQTDPGTLAFDGTEEDSATRAASLTTSLQTALDPAIGQPGFASQFPAAVPSSLVPAEAALGPGTGAGVAQEAPGVMFSASVGRNPEASAVDQVFGAEGVPWLDHFEDALALARPG